MPMTLSSEVAQGERPAVLKVSGLNTHFFIGERNVHAVNDVSFEVFAGETMALVGESGCGKSVTALSILGLIPPRQGRRVASSIMLDGREITGLSESEMQAVRGKAISMIFQEPMTSLHPMLTIGNQIAETLRAHERISRRAAWNRAVEMIELVRIPEPKRCARDHPHQLSGGMRQRVMIALALACNPRLLIADEPTTALDVTTEAQILDLMDELKRQFGTSILLITHNFGVVAEVADRVAVMYAGRKVEEAPVAEIFATPMHPYTRGLMAAVPRVRQGDASQGPGPRLHDIPGMVPRLDHEIVGCAFAPRCSFASERSRRATPPLEERSRRHFVACCEVDRVVRS